MGSKYYTYASDYLDILQQDNACIVEVGSENGDGSTRHFFDIALANGVPFYTVDVDTKQFGYTDKLFMPHVSKGQDFLRDVFPATGKKIAMLYLDNFDWIWQPLSIPDWIQTQIDTYSRQFNQEMNNINSSVAHLEQTMLAYPHFTDRAVVIVDDTWYDRHQGTFVGKCSASIYFLISKGFKIVRENPADFAFVLTNF